MKKNGISFVFVRINSIFADRKFKEFKDEKRHSPKRL